MDYINDGYYLSASHGSEEGPGSTTTPALDNKSAICFFFRAGNCRRGSSCPFVHPPVSDQMEGFAITHPAYQGEQIYAYPPPKQTPVYPPLISQAYSPYLWQPYPPFSPSFDPRYGILRQPDTFLDYPDDKSDSYSSESGSGSSSTATSLEDACKALGKLRVGSADQATTRGGASHPGDLGTIPSAGYVGYSYPVLPAVKAEYGAGRSRATSLGQCLDPRLATTFRSQYLLPWQDDPKKKPLAYKTKPCKFYAMNGKCTSGEKCTFIHDPETKNGNAPESPHELPLPSDVNLPPKPVSRYEDLKAKDFYPVTWRVIGGGVMMGGQRQVCPAFTAGKCKYGDDCKLAHETEVTSDRDLVELRSDLDGKAERSPRQSIKGHIPKSGGSSSQRRKSMKAPSPESNQSDVTSSATPSLLKLNLPSPEETPAAPKKPDETKMVSSKLPTSPAHRRTQSMTIVVTSPLPHDKAPSYAAEL